MSKWQTDTLGGVASIRRGIGYSDATLEQNPQDGVPYLNMKSFLKDGGYNKNGLKFFSGYFTKVDVITEEDLLIANTDITPGGDIIGVPALLPEMLRHEKVLFSHHVTRLHLNEQLDPKFLYYLLCTDSYRRSMRKYARGTTVLMLDMAGIKRMPIMYPQSKLMQGNIAGILSTVDTAIEQTEALIEKYQHIKAGLMHDLFTRGVLPNGQLRPPREQAPELYQETAIGWIPNEWTLVELESLLAPVPNNIRSGPFGSALLKGELVETGIPFLGIDNIHVECFNDDFRRFVSPKKFTELAKYAVRKKDVIITIMGTVGRCCVVPETVEVALSSKHLWTMTFDLEKVIPRLICWQLNFSAWVKSWFRRATQGGIMDAIQSSTLKRLVLPVPAMDEQLRIDVRYGFLTSRIDSEEQKLRKLRLKKLALMKALFTDKVII
jgi:type I restriction enzyme S subunit